MMMMFDSVHYYQRETKARRGDGEHGRLNEEAERRDSRGTHGHSLPWVTGDDDVYAGGSGEHKPGFAGSLQFTPTSQLYFNTASWTEDFLTEGSQSNPESQSKRQLRGRRERIEAAKLACRVHRGCCCALIRGALRLVGLESESRDCKAQQPRLDSDLTTGRTDNSAESPLLD